MSDGRSSKSASWAEADESTLFSLDPGVSLSEYVAPVELDGILDSLDEGILLLDPDLIVVAVNDTVEVDTQSPREQLVGSHIDRILHLEGIDEGDVGMATDEMEEFLRSYHDGTVETASGDTLPAEIKVIPRQNGGGASGYVVIYQLTPAERSPRNEHVTMERLGLVNQFNATLRRVSRAIIDPSNRQDLESVVCSELAAATPYEIAVIAEGGSHAGQHGVRPRAWAGIDDESVSDLLRPVQSDEGPDCPINTAISTGEIQVELQIHKNPVVASCLDRLSRNISSVAVIPIQFGETVYAVLTVYSSRDGPFEEFELRMLEEIGEIVGFAYNTVDKDQLLTTDSVVELEFDLTDPDSFYVDAASRTDTRIVLQSVVPTNGDSLLYYHRIEGGSQEEFVELAVESPEVEFVEVIRAEDDVSWVVIQFEERPLVEVLSSNNVNVRSFEVDRGLANLVCEICPTIDIETVTDLIATHYDAFELLAKRRRERPAFTTPEFRHEVLGSLTNKQQETLEAAYQSGYFNRPRSSTAEDVAAQLGISSSTFHQHLRAAMSKLMDILLDRETI